MIRFAVVIVAGLAACSHPPMKPDVPPGQVFVAGDATFTTRPANAIEVRVTRALGGHEAEGTATLHGIGVEEAKTSPLVAVAKGRAWLAVASALAGEPVIAFDAALRGLDELGTSYRGAKRDGKHVIDDTGTKVQLAKMSADKGDHASAAAEASAVLTQRIDLYVRMFAGAVE